MSNHNDPHWARRARLAREIGGAEGQDGRTSHILIDLQEDSTTSPPRTLGHRNRAQCVWSRGEKKSPTRVEPHTPDVTDTVEPVVQPGTGSSPAGVCSRHRKHWLVSCKGSVRCRSTAGAKRAASKHGSCETFQSDRQACIRHGSWVPNKGRTPPPPPRRVDAV